MSHTEKYLQEARLIIDRLDSAAIERMAEMLADMRSRQGRLFFLGVGGSAANCSHAVNDFRKLAGIEAYAPTDNVSELTARTNDEGWDTVFAAWLKTSRLSPKDMLFVFSVGGGNIEKNISPNLVTALRYAQEMGARILGVVGRDGGFTAKVADVCLVIPTVNLRIGDSPHRSVSVGHTPLARSLTRCFRSLRQNGNRPGDPTSCFPGPRWRDQPSGDRGRQTLSAGSGPAGVATWSPRSALQAQESWFLADRGYQSTRRGKRNHGTGRSRRREPMDPRPGASR